LTSNVQCRADTARQFLFVVRICQSRKSQPSPSTYHYSTGAKGNCDTFNSVTLQSYIYRYILPILGLDVTIDDLAHPESEDSEPFIIGVPEFLQPVISLGVNGKNESKIKLLIESWLHCLAFSRIRYRLD